MSKPTSPVPVPCPKCGQQLTDDPSLAVEGATLACRHCGQRVTLPDSDLAELQALMDEVAAGGELVLEVKL